MNTFQLIIQILLSLYDDASSINATFTNTFIIFMGTIIAMFLYLIHIEYGKEINNESK